MTPDEVDRALAEDGALGAMLRAWRTDIDSVPLAFTELLNDHKVATP